MKVKSKFSVSALSVILAIAILVTGVSALFTALAQDSTQGTAGTVRIDNINLRVQDVPVEASGTGMMGKGISNWNPGDINLVEWDVINLGNKSVCTRNTMFFYWDEDPDLRELGMLYIYPANMSDEDIFADMYSDNPSKFIGIGDDLKKIQNPEDETRYGYIWTFFGDILDGVGLGAETGDAREVNYNSTDYPGTTDDDSATMDHVAFKIALSPHATCDFMGKRWIMEVVTEAMQARNTSDSDWVVAATDVIGIDRPAVPEYDKKDDNLDPAAAISKAPYFVDVQYGAQIPASYDGDGIPEAYEDYTWPEVDYQLMGTVRNNAGKYNARADIKLDLLNVTKTDVSFDTEFVNNTATVWEIGNFRQYLYDTNNTVNWVIIKGSTLYYPEDTASITLEPGESVILRGYTKELTYISDNNWYAGAESRFRVMFDCWESGNKAETLFTPYADAKIAYLMPMVKGTGSLSLNVIDQYENIVPGCVYIMKDKNNQTVSFTMNNGVYLYDPHGRITQIKLDDGATRLGRLPVGDYTLVKVSIPDEYLGGDEKTVTVVEGAISSEYIEVTRLSKPPLVVDLRTVMLDNGVDVGIESVTYELYAVSGDIVSPLPVKFTRMPNGTLVYSSGGSSMTSVDNQNGESTRLLLPQGKYLFKVAYSTEGVCVSDFVLMVSADAADETTGVVEYENKAWKFTELYIKGNHHCALTTNGDLMDINTKSSTYGKIMVSDVDKVYQYDDRGMTGTFVIKKDGSLWSWGNDNFGQLGLGSSYTTTPGKVIGMDDVVSVDFANYSVYAIKADGSLWTWGYTRDGVTSGLKTVNIPIKVLDDVVSIATSQTTFGIGTYGAFEQTVYAVKNDGSLWAWGYNNDGQIGNGLAAGSQSYQETPDKILDDVGSVYVTNRRAGVYIGTYCTAYAIKTDGTLWAWGSNNQFQIGDGTGSGRLEPVYVTDNVDSIYANGYTTHIFKTDGSLWGWGYNTHGQVGDESLTSRYEPVELVNNVKKVISEYEFSSYNEGTLYLLKNDGGLWACGKNTHGQLGDGTQTNNQFLNEIMNDVEDAFAIQASYSTAQTGITAYAIKNDGSLWSWGYNEYGQLGDGTNTDREEPYKITESCKAYGYASVDSNYYYYILKQNGQLLKWSSGNPAPEKGGAKKIDMPVCNAVKVVDNMILTASGEVWMAPCANTQGEAGNGTNVQSKNLSKVNISDVVEIYSDPSYPVKYAVKSDGSVWGWGYIGGSAVRTPTKYLDDLDELYISGTSAFATKTDGSLWAWGQNNSYSKLGTGDSSGKASAVEIIPSGGAMVDSVVCGVDTTYAVKSDGSLWAWGRNDYGQVGDGTTISRYTPVEVFSSGVKSVYAYNHSAYIIKTDGSLRAWGYCGGGNDGRLGDGARQTQPSPVEIISSGVESLAVKDFVFSASMTYLTLFAKKDDGSPWVWGYNSYGQAGVGNSTTVIPAPVEIFDGGVSSVIAETLTPYVIKTDGSLWAWGQNPSGTVGNGTTGYQYSPVEIFTDGVASVNLGNPNTPCVLKTDGSLWSWGDNSCGQVGDGTKYPQYSPVEIFSGGVSSVTAYNLAVYAIKTDGSLWSWGRNFSYSSYGNGLLGDGTTTDRTTPYQLVDSCGSPLKNIVSVVPYGNNSYTVAHAVDKDGLLWMWGESYNRLIPDILFD